MAKQETKRAQLAQVQHWLSSWREEYRGRLARRMARGEADVAVSQQQPVFAAPKFVELNPFGSSPLVAHTQVVVHVTGQDGKGLKVSIHGSPSDVAIVVRELWGHAQ